MSESTPEFMSIAAAMDAKGTVESGANAAQRLRDAGFVKRVEGGPRTFISPGHPNERFLVRAGTLHTAPMSQSHLGMAAAVDRDGGLGDLWAVFNSGVCSTEDPGVITWLEAHSGDPEAHRTYHEGAGSNPRDCSTSIGLCQEQGAGVDDWYKMKLAQLPTSSRPATLDPEIDVDRYFLMGRPSKASTSDKASSANVSQIVSANENAAAERADGLR